MLNNQNVTLSDGRKVLVKELRIKDLLDALKRFESDDSDLKGGLLELLPQLCDLPESALVELYPSDLEKLVAAFKKANSFFFELAREIGLNKVARDLLAGLRTELSASITAGLAGKLPNLSAAVSAAEKSESMASPSSLPSGTDKAAADLN